MKKLLLLASISLANLNCMESPKTVTSPKDRNRKATLKPLPQIIIKALEMLAKKYELASAIFHTEKFYFEKSTLDQKTGQTIKNNEETSKFLEIKLIKKNDESYILTISASKVDTELFLKNSDAQSLASLINSSQSSDIKLFEDGLFGKWSKFIDEIPALNVVQKFNQIRLQTK